MAGSVALVLGAIMFFCVGFWVGDGCGGCFALICFYFMVCLEFFDPGDCVHWVLASGLCLFVECGWHCLTFG